MTEISDAQDKAMQDWLDKAECGDAAVLKDVMDNVHDAEELLTCIMTVILSRDDAIEKVMLARDTFMNQANRRCADLQRAGFFNYADTPVPDSGKDDER